jgi:hypothetical protein
VHLSCALHMAHPPVTRERRVLYTDFSLPHDGPRSPGEATLSPHPRGRVGDGQPAAEPRSRWRSTMTMTWSVSPRVIVADLDGFSTTSPVVPRR